jgi:hypothetical protein
VKLTDRPHSAEDCNPVLLLHVGAFEDWAEDRRSRV